MRRDPARSLKGHLGAQAAPKASSNAAMFVPRVPCLAAARLGELLRLADREALLHDLPRSAALGRGQGSASSARGPW